MIESSLAALIEFVSACGLNVGDYGSYLYAGKNCRSVRGREETIIGFPVKLSSNLCLNKKVVASMPSLFWTSIYSSMKSDAKCGMYPSTAALEVYSAMGLTLAAASGGP